LPGKSKLNVTKTIVSFWHQGNEQVTLWRADFNRFLWHKWCRHFVHSVKK